MPRIKSSTNITMKIKKSTFAMLVAADATPVKPKNAAMSATIRNIKAHFSNPIRPPFYLYLQKRANPDKRACSPAIKTIKLFTA
jgi:hypothetical protein